MAQIKITECSSPGDYSHKNIEQHVFQDNYQNRFLVKDVAPEVQDIKRIFDSVGWKIENLAFVNQAIALKKDRTASIYSKQEGNDFKPFLDGREINRYSIEWKGNYLKYDVKAIHSCKKEDIFLASEKIFFRRVSSKLIATLDTSQFYALNTLVVINLKSDINIDIRYLLALLNSKAVNWYYDNFFRSNKKAFSEIQARSVKQLPVPEISLSDPIQKKTHEDIVGSVNKMLELNSLLRTCKLENERQNVIKLIKFFEEKIDSMIYNLYGLNQSARDLIEKTITTMNS